MVRYITSSLITLLSLCWFIGSAWAQVGPQKSNNASTPTYSVAVEADDIVSRVLFDAAANKLNFHVNYQTHASFKSILDAVEAGTVDFAANVTYTSERENRFDFSHPTNIEYTYLFSKDGARFDQLNRVGVPAGTIYSDLINKHYPRLQQVSYEGGGKALELLNSGAVDGVLDAINQLKPMISAGYQATLLNDYLPIQPVSIVTTKHANADMLEKLETFFHSAEMQKTLSKSIQLYQLDIRRQALRAKMEESSIDRNKVFQIKLENGGQYVQYHENGSVTGISADIVLGTCDILAIRCDIVSDANEPWSSMYQDILDNKIDMLAPIIISEERSALMYFSDPYYEISAILAKRKGYKHNVYNNVSELIVEKIGVVRDDYYQHLLEKMLPNIELYTFETQHELMEGLFNKEVDYIAYSNTFFSTLLSESEELLDIEEDKQVGYFNTNEVAVAFPRTEDGLALAQLFSSAMSILNINQIVTRYNIHPNWREQLLLEKKVKRQEILLLLGALLLLAMLVTYFHIQSNTDGLTKLRNRRSLYRRYSRGVSPRVTFVYLDVNNFKQINDANGHDTGDKVLMQLTEKIKAHWKGRSYRIGGDEFILTDVISEDDLKQILSNLECFAFNDPTKSKNFDISVSVGISSPRRVSTSLEEVLHLADVEMYRKKRERRNNAINT
ncbi:transporter substrate-binding domain-containing protein [Vibrio sp. RC27]